MRQMRMVIDVDDFYLDVPSFPALAATGGPLAEAELVQGQAQKPDRLT
jgi:hypothetical protein